MFCYISVRVVPVDPHVPETHLLSRWDLVFTQAQTAPFILKKKYTKAYPEYYPQWPFQMIVPRWDKHFLFSIMYSLWVTSFIPQAVSTISVPVTISFLAPALKLSRKSGSHFELPVTSKSNMAKQKQTKKVKEPKQNSSFSPKCALSWPSNLTNYLTQNLLIPFSSSPQLWSGSENYRLSY